MKITKKIATVATLAFAAFMATSAVKAANSSGHIISIEPVNYNKATSPALGVGEKVQILVRMLNSNWSATFGNATAHPPKPWYFISLGVGSTNLASAAARPMLGLSIGGKIAYAEYVEAIGSYVSGPNQEVPYYTDLYFEYTVKPGDLGLPIKLLNSNGKVADEVETDNSDYCLINANTAGKNWGAYWTLSNVDGEIAGFHLAAGYGSLDYPTKPNNTGAPAAGDVSLSAAQINVQTIDFDDTYSADNSTIWRDVYPKITDNVSVAPRILGEGGTEGAVVYVWSDNSDVFEPYSPDPADYVVVNGTKCLKIQIAPGAKETTFRLKGGEALEGTLANIYMSSSPLGETDKIGDTLESSIVKRTVRMVAPPPPSVRITFDPEGTKYFDEADASIKSEMNLAEDKIPLYITLSESYSSTVEVALNPKYGDDATKDLFTSNYIAIANTDAPTGYNNFDTNVVFTPPEKQKVVYLYALGGDSGTAAGGIKFDPTIADSTISEHYKQKIGCSIRIKDAKPVILSPAISDTLSADKKAGCPISIEVSDTHRDLNAPQTYSVEVIWEAGTTFTTNGVAFRNGQPTQIIATGFSSSATKAKIKVTDPQNNSVQTDWIPLTVAATKKIFAELVDEQSLSAPAITDLRFGEDSPTKFIRFRIEPESAANVSKMYAFLVPLNEASSNLVSTTATSEGVLIEGESTLAIGTTPQALKFLDGTDSTADLRFGIMLRTENVYTNGTEILDYESQTLMFSVTNTPSRVTSVSYNGGTPIKMGSTIKVPEGIPTTFIGQLADDSFRDLTNGISCVWAIRNPDDYTKVVNENANSNGVASTKYTFNGEGSIYTVSVYAHDKDWVSGDVPVFEFNVEVAKQPYIYFSSVAKGEPLDFHSIEETASVTKRYLYVNLSQAPDATCTTAKPLKIGITATQIGDGGNLVMSTTNVSFTEGVKTGGNTQRITLNDLDGYAENASIWTISAKVLNDNNHSNDLGVVWNQYYTSRDLELTVNNIAPAISRFTPGNALTNSPSLYSKQEFTIYAKDCSWDITNQMQVIWIDSSGMTHDLELYKDGQDWKSSFTNEFVREKEQQVSVQLVDKDGELSEKIVWNFIVAPTKRVEVTPYGPAASSQTKYSTAAGRGKGRVWADAMRYTLTSFRHVYFMDVTEQQAGVYAYGYPAAESAAGYPDDGNLKDSYGESGRDIKISPSGRIPDVTRPTYFTYGRDGKAFDDEWKYDNFFYCWVDVSSESGSALSDKVNGVPNPAMTPTNETYVTVTLDAYEKEKDAYQVRNVEAVFSREYLTSDNMGDINADGIPDLYVRAYKLDGDTATAPANDLVKKTAENTDGDYLPATLSGIESSLIPGLPGSWAMQGFEFNAKLEIRGFGEGLNDAPAVCGLIKEAKPDRIYADPETNPDSTLTKAEYLAFLESGLEPSEWSPERPTDPTMADTDEDGLEDGYEYYYWYRAHVGWIDRFGNHVYLTGERFNEMKPGEPQKITSEEIKRLFDPIVPADLSALDERDTDNDGLIDVLEYELGTSPIDWDTDGDGLPDGYEVMLSAQGGDAYDPLMAATTPGLADTLRNFDNDYMAALIYAAKDKKMMVFGTKDDYYAVNGSLLDFVKLASEYDPSDERYSEKIRARVITFADGRVVATTNTVETYKSVDGEGNEVDRLKSDLLESDTWVHTIFSPDGEAGAPGPAIVGLPITVKRGAVIKEIEEDVEIDKLLLNTYQTNSFGEITDIPWNLNKITERFYKVWKYGIDIVSNNKLVYGFWAMSGDAILKPGTQVLVPPVWSNVGKFHYMVYASEMFDPRTAWKSGGADTRAYCAYDEFLVSAFFAQNGKAAYDLLPVEGDGSDELSGYYIDQQKAVDIMLEYAISAENPLQAIWGRFTTNPNSADTDGDKVPDGWELYVMGGASTQFESTGFMYPAAGPMVAMSPLITESGTDDDGDGLTEMAEYAGSESTQYAGEVAANDPVNPYWTNKKMPTDPWNGDTDDDGISDSAEMTFFAYGEPSGPGAGGGLNPLSWDTDNDGLPDPWEVEFTGEYIAGESSKKTEEVVGQDGTTNTVTTTVTAAGSWSGGMDGSRADAFIDYDSDGLQNWQEYLVGAMRCWRYDDTFSSWSKNSFVSEVMGVDLKDNSMIPNPVAHPAEWNEYWYQRLVLGPDTKTEGVMVEYNPNLVDRCFDGGNSYFSLCTNEWDTAAGGWYMFKDGIYHDLARPGPEWTTLLEKEVQLNRFTWWIFKRFGSPEDSKFFNVNFTWGNEKGQDWYIYPTKYICCDPRKPDTDRDGMDDYYEMFHGMNPILGASGKLDKDEIPYDVIYEAYRENGIVTKPEGDPYPIWSAERNFWTHSNESETGARLARTPNVKKGEFGYDFVAYPWLNGLAYADPDGDNIRNQSEAIMPGFQAASTFLHTDPTPLWMTDGSYTGSLTYRYYQPLEAEMEGGALLIPEVELNYFEKDLDGDGKINLETERWYFNSFPGFTCEEGSGQLSITKYEPLKIFGPANTLFSFEQNEGYDSDHDYLSDFEESQGKTKSASDAQSSDSPLRRQAMWFDGVNSFLQTPLKTSEAAPTEHLPGIADLEFLYFTVECWAKADGDLNKTQTLIERPVWTADANGGDEKYLRRNFWIGMKNGRWAAAFDSAGTDAKQAVEISDGPLATTNWTHIAASYDGVALRLYVDGICVKESRTSIKPENGVGAYSVTPYGTHDFHSLKYSLVSLLAGASAATERGVAFDYYPKMTSSKLNMTRLYDYKDFYCGWIDEVRVWDGARTPAQILADYKKRYSKEDALNNRAEVYQAWRSGATFTEHSPITRPSELRYHFVFDHLPGAVSTDGILKTPAGFTTAMNKTDSMAIWVRPDDWFSPWWNDYDHIGSKVYDDRAWVPWINNTITHLPRFDKTTLDSFYWSEDFAGSVPSSQYGFAAFKFPRTAEVYSNWIQLYYEDERDPSITTRLDLVKDNPELLYPFAFTFRRSVSDGGDFLPFGNAYPKRATTLWDEQGAMDAWAETGLDSDNNGLPDWWETYARQNYGVGFGPIDWNTTVTYNGVLMTAWQAYLRDLAAGLLNDGKIHTEYRSLVDNDKDGLLDWWEDYWLVSKYSGDDDPDHDGLSNKQEWRISEDIEGGFGSQKGYPALNPIRANSLNNQKVPDYFLRYDSTKNSNLFSKWYLGEIVADHDMLEDDDEKALGTDPTLYDAWSDKDEDGWTAWSEQRYSTFKMSIVARLISHMNGSEEVIDSPIPVIHTTLRYNGEQAAEGTNTAAIVVEAYSGNNLQKKPNATWRIAPGETEERYLYLGAWDRDKVFHGSLVPGHIFPGVNEMVIQYAFVQGSDNFSWEYNGRVFHGTYDEMLAAYTADPLNVFVSAAPFEWVDVYDGMVTNDMRSALQIAIDEKTQKGHFLIMNKKVGEIDAITGDFTLNLAQFEGFYMLDTQVSLEQSIFRLKYRTRVPTTQTKALPITLGRPDSGSLKEGNTALVAYMDLDGSGAYTPGEPLGIKKDVEIGWDQVPALTIEMTDNSVAVGKRFAYDDTVETLRIIRTAINGRETFEDGTEVKRRIVFSRNAKDVERKTVYEGDLITTGKFGLDWTGLRSDILALGLQLKDVNEVTYKVVKNTASLERIEEENIIDTITVAFSAQQIKPTAVSPSASSMGIVESQRPTFIWTGTDDNTAFMLKISDLAGNVVYSNDMQLLPPRDANGRYVWQAPVYIGTNSCNDAWALNNTASYTWQVAMFNAKYSSPLDAVWSDPATFSTALAASNDMTTEFGTAKVAVRYYGPATNTLDQVVVALYKNADFTGEPAAQSRLYDVDGAACDKLAVGVFEKADGLYEVTFMGLESGDYYAMAYIDRNGNMKRDKWESWGYANQIGLGYQAIYTPVAAEVDADVAVQPYVTVYIEDTDVNQDDIPDCLTEDESILSAATKTMTAGSDETDTDLDGLTADEETGDSYTEKAKWDSDDDGMPDGWEYRFADLDPLYPDADLVVSGDTMAFAVETGKRVYDASGTSYLLMTTNDVTYRVGDVVTNEHLATYYDYKTVIGSGTNVSLVTYCGVGTNLTGTAATFKVDKIEDVTIAYVHAQVYDRYGYSLKTAIPQDGAINTKPFTALDKYMVVRYLAALGLADEETMNISKMWKDYTLKPRDVDNDRDGIADGWELYVMFGTNGCGFVEGALGAVEKATSLSQVKISPWNFADRELDLDGDGLSNVNENSDGNDPSDPWNQHSVYQSLVAEGVIPPSTEKFDDKVRRFGIGESQLAEDWDLDQISNGQEMWAYYIDYAKGSTLLADIDPNNAWSDKTIPDYFRKGVDVSSATNYLGAIYNGGEFLERDARANLDIVDRIGVGTRDLFQAGWDIWSIVRYSYAKREKEMSSGISEELSIANKYTYVMYSEPQYSGATEEELVKFHSEELGHIECSSLSNIILAHGGLDSMKQAIREKAANNLRADGFEVPEPVVKFTFLYTGNNALDVTVDAWQTSSFYPERGEQLTASWALKPAFDSGVAYVESKVTARGTIKQGKTRFIAYVDANGDGRLSPGETWGMADANVGYEGNAVTIRLGDTNDALPVLQLTSADTNKADRVIQTVAIVRTKINGERVEPRGVMLRNYDSNVNRTYVYPLDYVDNLDGYIGIDKYLSRDRVDKLDPSEEDLAAVEEVTYEILKLKRSFVSEDGKISTTNLNYYTYTEVVIDKETGLESNVYHTVEQAVNEEFTVKYSVKRDIALEVKGEAGSTISNTKISFTIPADRAVTKFWLEINGTVYDGGDGRGYIISRTLRDDVANGSNGEMSQFSSGRVILDSKWFKDNNITLSAGENKIRVALGNDKFPESPDRNLAAEWSAESKFNIAQDAQRKGTMLAKVVHPLADDSEFTGKLTVAVYEKADLAESVLVTNNVSAGDTVELTGLRVDRGYYLAAWYVKSADDGRESASERKPYDTWGYITSLGVATNGFNAAVIKAVDPAMTQMSTNVIYLQDTDWNDNGIIDREEDIKSNVGTKPSEAPEWDPLDIDGDGIVNGDDNDPVFDNANDSLEKDVMARAAIKMLTVKIGTMADETNWVTYVVYAPESETCADKLSGDKIIIPRGTKASDIKSLYTTYKYGRRATSPMGLGRAVSVTDPNAVVYAHEWQEIVLLHHQVYQRFGFNPDTANALTSQSNWVHTAAFTSLDKSIVTNYLCAIGALADDATHADWTLNLNRIDFDFDGLADGWELYTMFGTNKVQTLTKTEKSDVINAWVKDDRNLDADGDMLTNLHEYNGGFEPSDPWNAYSVYENFFKAGLLLSGTEKFTDAEANRFGLKVEDIDKDSDGDLLTNLQEIQAYYYDRANLYDLSPTNAWSNGAMPDYFRVMGSTYLGAYYNGGEFIEPTVRKALGMDGLLHAGTRNYKNSAWDIWSTARYSIKNRDNNLNVDGVVSDELMLLIRYWDVIRPGEFTGTTVKDAIDFFHETWEGVVRLIDEEGNVLIEGKDSDVFGWGTIHDADAAQTTSQVVAFFGGQKKMEETILLNKKDITEKEIVTPEPAVDLVLKYAGNSSYNLVLEAYQVSSAYPEMGDQMTAQWTTPVKFDSGVAIVKEMKTPALGSLKQGAARFIAYFDNNGDGKLSAGETWGMAESIVGYEGVDISIRMSDSNGAMPVIELVSADTNALDRSIQTVAIVRTKINGERVQPRGVMLRYYNNNVNRTIVYPNEFIGESYIGIDSYLAGDKREEGVDPDDTDLSEIESVTYEIVKLHRHLVKDGNETPLISVTNMNYYVYAEEVVDELTGKTSNVYHTVEQAVNEEFTLKYSIKRDIPLEVRGEASSTEGDALVSFQVPADRAVTKFWLTINGTEVPTPEGRGFAITGLLSGSVLAEEGGVYESSRVILDGKWFEDNNIALMNGEYTIKVALGNDKFPKAPAADAEWSNEAKFNVAKASDNKGEIIVMVKHSFATLEDGKLTLAVYEKADLANPVKVYAGTNTEEQITLDGLRENGMYYVAAWYVKDAEDGRLNEKMRMPYDTWGYYSYANDVVENKILLANAFEPLALKAVADAKSKNIIFLQDTDWNDNGIIDRDEDIKSVISESSSKVPAWDELDIDGDGIIDDDDKDPVFDNATDALENDVMAYQLKRMLCVQIGTSADKTNAWYIVSDPAIETNTLNLADGELAIPRGTSASALKSLKKTYLYGKKKSSPYGMGQSVKLTEGTVYACEYKDIVLVHAQVYEENGFNPLTANGFVGEENGINTKKFTSLDKYLVTNYLHAVGALSDDSVWTKWVLCSHRLDFDYDGIPDGWELYVMSGPAGAGKLIAHSPWKYADRSYDADQDGLDQLKEYDMGNNPTDPWSKDTDGNGIGDYDSWKYDIKGEGGLRRDSDNDQLSNFMELMISNMEGFPVLDAGRMATNAEKFGGDQLVPDYFLKHGSLYLGEMFTDHDFIEDWFEDAQPVEIEQGSTRIPNITRFRYDASGDVDGDGWSNWAEARAEIASPTVTVTEVITNGAAIVSNVYETTEFALNGSRPSPELKMTLLYSGLCGNLNGKKIVVKAWSQENPHDMQMTGRPDAVWYFDALDQHNLNMTVTLGKPANGYLREGKNMFVAYVLESADVEASAPNRAQTSEVVDVWTPGMPYGVVTDVNVGYMSGDTVSLEMTDTNASMLRIDLKKAMAAQASLALTSEDPNVNGFNEADQAAMNDLFVSINAMTDRKFHDIQLYPNFQSESMGTNMVTEGKVRVRVLRSLINGYGDLRNVFFTKLVLDTRMDISENGYLTEANLLAAGLNEIDFGTIWSDWVKSTEDFLDITNATYRIVVGEGTVDSLKLNNDIAVAFVNAFEKGDVQTPTVLGDVVLSGSQPTFTWSHTNSIGKAYPMFQLRIWEKDGAKELVFDSGKIRAPARDANGLYKWTAPVYDGMLTAEGKTFFTASNYTWSVSMLDAKFSEPWDYEDGVAKSATFRLGGSSAAGGLADYALIPVAVKYMGPGEVSTTSVTNLIRVEAYTSSDFSGRPCAVAYVKHTNTLDAENMVELNAMVTGLPLGKSYHMLAYIDTNGNGVRDEWESWGYGNFVGTDRKDVYTPRAYELASKEVHDGTVPDCVIYIEDADTNDNKIPDVWEWNKDGKLGGEHITSDAYNMSPYFVTLNSNGAIATNIFFAIEAGTVDLPFYSVLTQMQNGNKLSAASLALAMAGIDLSKLDVKPEVKITSFSLTDGITIKVDPKAEINGETFKPTVVKVDVKLTLTLQKSDSLTDGWTNVKTISETFTLSSDATEIPSSKLEAMNTVIKSNISGAAGFYRIMVGVE